VVTGGCLEGILGCYDNRVIIRGIYGVNHRYVGQYLHSQGRFWLPIYTDFYSFGYRTSYWLVFRLLELGNLI
jgi:hypothetical protein